MQQSAAALAPVEAAMSFDLLKYLFQRKVWLAGIIFDCSGYGFQALALSVGPLSLVEPLFVSGLLFALILGVIVHHRALSVTEWIGTFLVTVGLVAFVIATQPQEGNYNIGLIAW